MENLEAATEHLLRRTRRQAAELSRLVAQLERLQGDIRSHQESLGTRHELPKDGTVPFVRDE